MYTLSLRRVTSSVRDVQQVDGAHVEEHLGCLAVWVHTRTNTKVLLVEVLLVLLL